MQRDPEKSVAACFVPSQDRQLAVVCHMPKNNTFYTIV
jgi:hypothetical protein